jgi:hypothetical protein
MASFFSCQSLKKRPSLLKVFFLNITFWLLHQICFTIVSIELIMYCPMAIIKPTILEIATGGIKYFS